jgi:DNA replication protein DnaC
MDLEEQKNNVLLGKTERYRILNATTECPYGKCDGSGWKHVEDTHYHFLEAKDKQKSHHIQYKKCNCHEARQKRKELDETLRNAKIPEKFLDAAISNFDLMKYTIESERSRAAYAKRLAARFVAKFDEIKEQGKGIYFHSDKKGSGKTRLAISIGNALFKKYGVVPLYIPAVELFSEIQSTFEKDSDKSTTKVVETFRNAELLIIDDIGVEETGSRKKDRNTWKEQMMTKLLDHRMDNNLITLFTANIPIDKLSGDTLYPIGRVESRVRKMAYAVEMPEESVRDLEAHTENREFEDLLMREE